MEKPVTYGQLYDLIDGWLKSGRKKRDDIVILDGAWFPSIIVDGKVCVVGNGKILVRETK